MTHPCSLSITEQNSYILMKSGLSVLSFMDHVFDVVSKKTSPNPRSCRFSSILFSRSFIGSHFIFRSVIYSELILLKDVRSVSRFIVLACHYPVVPAHLLKKLSLLHCIAFAPLSKISWLNLFLFLVLYSVLLICSSILPPKPHCLDYCSFIVSLEVRCCQSPNFVLLQYCAGYFRSSYQSPCLLQFYLSSCFYKMVSFSSMLLSKVSYLTNSVSFPIIKVLVLEKMSKFLKISIFTDPQIILFTRPPPCLNFHGSPCTYIINSNIF